MTIQLHFPRTPLNQFIDCFWFVDTTVPYTREKILPSSNIELMINFGSPHRRYDATETSFELMKESWIAGFQTSYIVNEPVAETCMMGVRFKPSGAYPFLGLPIAEITNFVIDVELLWGNFIHEVRERLLALATAAEKFRLLEQLLLQRFDHEKYKLSGVAPAIKAILAANGSLALRTLSDEIGISQKHLISQFKKSVGVSPKQFARVIRFQTVLGQINPWMPIDWRTVAYACQFYDQAHFNHEFATFTGLSPSEYVALRKPLLKHQKADNRFVPIIG